jgi:membrane-associated HD superfamily phosphohydrolase
MLWVFFVIMTLGMTVILSLNLRGGANLAIARDQPAPNDIFAPRSLTYISDIETAQDREDARRSVAEVYSSLDLTIGRSQLSRARAVLSFMEVVRADTNAATEEKIEYLQAIDELLLEESLATEILNLDQTDFDEVRADIVRIIEDLMREEIRPSQLADYQRNARRLASLDLTPPQTAVVTGLAHQFIIPTVFPDPEATELARQEAAAAVEPVTLSVAQDQRVLRAGEIVTARDIEL